MSAARVPAETLTRFVADLFTAAGVSKLDAGSVAHCLVEADLRGIATHGVSRVAIYLQRIALGHVDARAEITVEALTPVAARVDGANGLGFLVARRAMAEAMIRAREFGIGICFAHRSSHFGMAASYLRQAIDGGFAAFVFTNASPAMPVWGGKTPFLGTSPFAFGAPGGEDSPPILLDMATSVVARGKIRRAAVNGEPIPADWALDRDGNATTDAAKAYKGTILPLGGPKGSGLSLMMEVLCGVMSGAAFGGQVGNQYMDSGRPQNVGHLFIALRPDLALDMFDYRRRFDELSARAKACDPVKPGGEILFPGEPEARIEAARLSDGIPLSDDDMSGLEHAAARLGVEMPEGLRRHTA